MTNYAKSFLRLTLSREDLSPQASGFVIAGFGKNEYFPTVLEYNTDGYVGNNVKIASKRPAELSREMQSCVRAFTQGDMVARFMNGIDGQLHAALLASFMGSLNESCWLFSTSTGIPFTRPTLSAHRSG